MAEKERGGRFASLRTLRQQHHDYNEELEHDLDTVEEGGAPLETSEPAATELPPAKPSRTKFKKTKEIAPLPAPAVAPIQERRGPGRPPGRRSDPDYTQISAYIPLDLLLSVQDALSEERRRKRRRTPRPVSDLIEDLLAEWMNAWNSASSKK